MAGPTVPLGEDRVTRELVLGGRVPEPALPRLGPASGSGPEDLRLLCGELLLGEDPLSLQLGKVLELPDRIGLRCGRGRLRRWGSSLLLVCLLAIRRDLRITSGEALGLTALHTTTHCGRGSGYHGCPCHSAH
jgi:hypothetical protein